MIIHHNSKRYDYSWVSELDIRRLVSFINTLKTIKSNFSIIHCIPIVCDLDMVLSVHKHTTDRIDKEIQGLVIEHPLYRESIQFISQMKGVHNTHLIDYCGELLLEKRKKHEADKQKKVLTRE